VAKTNRVQTTINIDLGDMAGSLAGLLGAKVGYLAETTGPQTYDNGLTLASNAVIQEFGTDRIPPRPFMRAGAEAFDKKDAAIGNVLRGVIEGRTGPVEGSNALGVMLQAEILRAFRSGDFTPNAPATTRRKGSSQPLIDTGKLRQGVDVRTK
jgi:hypothetical protein